MKILQISIEVNSGSVGRIAEQIGQLAISHGWESYITYARNNLPSKSETIKISSKFDLYCHAVQTRIFDNHGFASIRSTKRLINKIEEISPDIIHLHHLHGYYINIEILFNYLAKRDIPIVWTFHDCWSFTGHCAHFEYVNCNKWIDGCYNCEQKNEYPKSLGFDRSQHNYLVKSSLFNSVANLTIVPVSYWLGDLVQKSFLKGFPIKVIQNGIDLTVFEPKNVYEVTNKYKLNNVFVILGVASTWDKRKGLKYFIELNELLPSDCRIVLVGLSRKQLEELPENIIGMERTENVTELAELYSVANVFVNPTLEDTFPTTNLEALACGTPVITYRTGGSVESVDEKTGIVVTKSDVNGLMAAIRKVRDNGKGFYTENCRKRALRLYNKDDRFESYITLYKELTRK